MYKRFHIHTSIATFCSRYPALFLGFSLWLSCFAALSGELYPIFLFGLLITLNIFHSPKTCAYIMVLSLVMSFYAWHSYDFPHLPEGGIHGKGHLQLSSITKGKSSFSHSPLLRGNIKRFVTFDGDEFKNISFSLVLPKGIKRPTANRDYAITGTLSQWNSKSRAYRLKVKKDAIWEPIKGTYSLAEQRYRLKRKLESFLQKSISQKKSASFLSGLATGDFSDRHLIYSLGALGLQHIMAISGFHFSLVALFLSVFFRIFFPPKYASGLIIFMLASYFIFLGCSPSILRAWIASLLGLMASFFRRENTPLNSLGVAMVITLLYSPILCLHLGFQFSFLATASIFFFFDAFDKALQVPFTKLSLSAMTKKNLLQQHSYVFFSLLRQAFSLVFAIHLTILPTMLFFFHKFPLMGLAFNLFFPLLVSLAMALLLVSLLCACFSSILSNLAFAITGTYTQWVLDVALQSPNSMNIVWYVAEFPILYLNVYLSVVFFLGILWRNSRKENGFDLVI